MHNWTQRCRNQISYFFAGAIILLTFLIAGCSAASIRIEPTRPSPPLTPAPEDLSFTNPANTPALPQMLRITNQSTLSIRRLVVRFPEDRVDFGEVAPGATTEYQAVSHGVFRYAAYDVELEGQKYQQPVIDWVGETPMNGKAFTYILDVDPARWKTEGQVIRLVQVNEDQIVPSTITQLPQLPAQVYFPALDRIQMFDERSGWAIASETLQLLQTTDGGRTWRDVTPAGLVPGWFPYSSAYFLDPTTAWIPAGGKIFRTTNGGQTWQDFTTPFHLVELQFIDHKTGWAFADSICGAGTCWLRLFQTDDGGQTWSLMNIDGPNGPETAPPSLPSGSIHINSGDSFKFSDPSTLWFGGNGIVASPTARLMVSRDQGKSWQGQNLPLPQRAPDSGAPNEVDLPTFLTASEGYFAAKYEAPGKEGASPQSVMAVYATQDGGRTWTVSPTLVPDVAWFDPIDFVSLNTAFVHCGEAFCVTHDGAKTWQTIQSNKQFPSQGDEVLSRYDFVNAQTGWAIVLLNGDSLLYQTTDGGVTWKALKMEDQSYRTPIPESTLMAFRSGTPIANKVQAVIAARVLVSQTRMESLQPSEVIFVERMTLAEAKKKAAKPGTESYEDIPADTPVWFVVFKGAWQVHPPSPGQTVTPPPPFYGCQYVWTTENGNGYAATGYIDCGVR